MGFEGIGPVHILIVLIVIFLLFGARRLPELGKSLGSGIREFKKSTHELQSALDTSETPPIQALNAAAPAQPSVATPAAADAPPAARDS